jgi:hypothetical protein
VVADKAITVAAEEEITGNLEAHRKRDFSEQL